MKKEKKKLKIWSWTKDALQWPKNVPKTGNILRHETKAKGGTRGLRGQRGLSRGQKNQWRQDACRLGGKTTVRVLQGLLHLVLLT